MKLAAMTMTAAALALTACGHKETTTTMTTDNTVVATNDIAAVPTPNGGQSFANTAAASDAFEIATSKLALDKSGSAAVKKFAQKMIDAHTGSTARLKAIAAGAVPAITPDPTLTAGQQATVDSLKNLTGPDFDKAYAAAQVDGHQKTLDALKAYAATGDVPAFKDFATNLVPTVTAHLNMAKSLKP